MIDNSVLLSSVNATVQPTVLSIAYGVPPSQFKKSCPKEAARYKSAPVLKFQTAATVVRGEPGQALAVQPNDGAAANGKPPPGVPNGLVHSLNGGGGGTKAKTPVDLNGCESSSATTMVLRFHHSQPRYLPSLAPHLCI